ncbi:hypothetical protein P3T43_003959 [Paraburkholderia sp. GAS41]
MRTSHYHTNRSPIAKKVDLGPEAKSDVKLAVRYVVSDDPRQHVYAVRLLTTKDCYSGATTGVSAILDPVGANHE